MSATLTPQIFDIPLVAGVPQTFLITLNEVDYRFTLQWRDAISVWILDIADAGNNPVLCGSPLVTGANLFEQYDYLNFGGELWVITEGAPSDTPTFTSLGATSHLRFITGGTWVWNYY